MRLVAIPPTAKSFFFDEGLNSRGGVTGSGVTRPPPSEWECKEDMPEDTDGGLEIGVKPVLSVSGLVERLVLSAND